MATTKGRESEPRVYMKITVIDPLTGTIRRFFERPDGLYDESIVKGRGVQWQYGVQLDFLVRLLARAAEEGYQIQTTESAK